ncbi:MAG: hypothetical protein ABSB41_03945 [Anaerolineales bacterium]
MSAILTDADTLTGADRIYGFFPLSTHILINPVFRVGRVSPVSLFGENNVLPRLRARGFDAGETDRADRKSRPLWEGCGSGWIKRTPGQAGSLSTNSIFISQA